MQAEFRRKPDFHFNNFIVEKTVTVPAGKLDEMLRHPARSHEAILENAGVMGVDGDGVYHCLLVTGDGRADGMLVESEGSGCARYASYVPEATALRYPALSKLNRELAAAVDAIIAGGARRVTEGNWTAGFEELEEMTGLCVEGEPFLRKTLRDMLRSRSEVADCSLNDGQLDVAYRLDFCPGCRKETAREGPPDKAGREDMKSSSQEDAPAGTPGMAQSM